MDLNVLLVKKNITQYKLSKISGIPQSTISDLCLNKTSPQKCSAITLFKIASSLNVTVEDFLTKEFDENSLKDFEVFKSSVCQLYKSMEPIEFINKVLKSKKIQKYFKEKQFAKSFYLCAFVDYASDENHIKRSKELDFFRTLSLFEPLYPQGVIILDNTLKTNKNKKEALKKSIPQFKKYNIIESDINNVY